MTTQYLELLASPGVPKVGRLSRSRGDNGLTVRAERCKAERTGFDGLPDDHFRLAGGAVAETNLRAVRGQQPIACRIVNKPTPVASVLFLDPTFFQAGQIEYVQA